MQDKEVQHIFLVGAKSLGSYGGYETFIDKLTEYHQNNNNIKYYVACKANGDGSMDPYKTDGAKIISENEFVYHNAYCFRIKIPEKLGSAQAIYYDIAALKKCCRIIKEERIEHPIIYIMACRIGALIKYFYKKIHKLGGRIFLNPDGHEWMRRRWSKFVRQYWKFSERLMIKWSDLVICDSINIEKYVHENYDGKGIAGTDPKTIFIAYGAEVRSSKLSDDDAKLIEWYESHDLKPYRYYLIVGRFVPENNFETMIREFMRSKSERNLAIITNVNDKFLRALEQKLQYKTDPRIRFVGTIYDKELLMKIRENAFAYLHGHEVGGTNPSLLEALGSTELNLLLDVDFNREVANDAAMYWTKNDGILATLINETDQISVIDRVNFGIAAKERISKFYSWQFISDEYSKVWYEGAL